MLPLLLAAAISCPSDQIIGLDLKPWKAAILADRPGSDEQHAEMAALRMKTVPEGNQGDADCFDQPVVEGVDIFEANLTGEKDKLVQVRFRMCKGTPDEWQSLRLAVLVPLPEKKFCLLGGEDLSVDQSVRNRACDAPGKLPMTVGFKELIEKGRKVIERRDEQGSCSDPQQQMSNRMLALYQAQGLELKKIFEAVLLDSHPTGSGGQLVQKATVTYTGAFPKAIHVEQCTEGVQGCESEEYVYSKPARKYVSK